MKKLLTIVAVLLAIAVVQRGRTARAYPGAMCFNGSGCGRCEVCVKKGPTEPAGECMPVAGCH